MRARAADGASVASGAISSISASVSRDTLSRWAGQSLAAFAEQNNLTVGTPADKQNRLSSSSSSNSHSVVVPLQSNSMRTLSAAPRNSSAWRLNLAGESGNTAALVSVPGRHSEGGGGGYGSAGGSSSGNSAGGTRLTVSTSLSSHSLHSQPAGVRTMVAPSPSVSLRRQSPIASASAVSSPKPPPFALHY